MFQLFAQLRVLHDGKRALQPGDVERLGRRHQRDRVLGDLRVQRGNRDVLVPGKQQVAVDLIRADHHALAQADLRHALQLRPAEDPPHRVVRVAQHKQAGLLGDGCLESIPIDAIIAIRAAS